MTTNDTNSAFQDNETKTYALKLVTTELVLSFRDRPSPHCILGPDYAAQILRELIGRKDREHFVALHLNASHRIVAVETVSVGHLTAALAHPREIFKAAILNNAQAIICGHNHPSGDPTPSVEDFAVYKRLKACGELLSIPVLDSLVVTHAHHVSLMERVGN